MLSNEAVWLTAKRTRFEIKPAPYTPPHPGRIEDSEAGLSARKVVVLR